MEIGLRGRCRDPEPPDKIGKRICRCFRAFRNVGGKARKSDNLRSKVVGRNRAPCGVGIPAAWRGPERRLLHQFMRPTARRIKQNFVQVAVLSTTRFAAGSLQVKSLRFGRTGTEASASSCSLRDVNADKRPDRVCLFPLQRSESDCSIC